MADVLVSSVDFAIDPSIKRARRLRYLIFSAQVALTVGLIAAWQFISGYLDPLVFSSPHDIALRLKDWLKDGTIYQNLLATAEEVILGYVIGAVSAIILGLLLGSYPLVARILDPVLMGINGVPKIAFGPLFIVWFGINIVPKVVLCGLMVFFFVFFATYDGARNVDRALLRTIRLMGATRFQERLLVVIPGSMPAILLGLKLAIPQALVGAIVGELIVSNRGIGYLIEYSASQLDSAGVFAGLFILMILAIVANSAVTYATKKTSMEDDGHE